MTAIDYIMKISGVDDVLLNITDNLKKISTIQKNCENILDCSSNRMIYICSDNVILISKWLLKSKNINELKIQCSVFDNLIFNDFEEEYVDKNIIDTLIE